MPHLLASRPPLSLKLPRYRLNLKRNRSRLAAAGIKAGRPLPSIRSPSRVPGPDHHVGATPPGPGKRMPPGPRRREELLLWVLLGVALLFLGSTLRETACNVIRKVTTSGSWVIHPGGGSQRGTLVRAGHAVPLSSNVVAGVVGSGLRARPAVGAHGMRPRLNPTPATRGGCPYKTLGSRLQPA